MTWILYVASLVVVAFVACSLGFFLAEENMRAEIEDRDRIRVRLGDAIEGVDLERVESILIAHAHWLPKQVGAEARAWLAEKRADAFLKMGDLPSLTEVTK